MAITVKSIIPAKYAEVTQTTQYTATNCKTIFDKFTVTNVGTTNEDISINLVASGDTAAAYNLILSARTLVPGEVYTCPEIVGQVLENGDFVSTLATKADSLTISAGGRELT